MNIIIVGGGTIGSTLAHVLEKDHLHNITLIEQDAKVCEELENRFDIHTIAGNPLDALVLKKARLADSDMVIAVTAQDEVNILFCHAAMKSGVPQRIARVSKDLGTPELLNLAELGVTDLIEPEAEAVENILEYLYMPELTHVVNLSASRMCLRGFVATAECKLLNRPVSELPDIIESTMVHHIMIIRDGHALVPTGSTKIRENDEVISLMPVESLPHFRTIFNRPETIRRKVVITGSSPIAIQLAERIQKICDRVILISEDADFCREAADKLSNIEIYQGDPASEEVRSEANTGTASFFIPVDDDTEDNIITGLLAKAEGARHVIAVTNANKHSALFKTLGIDHIIQPSALLVRRIFSDIAGFGQGTVFRLSNIDLEMGHFYITPATGFAGSTILHISSKVRFNFIVGTILRNNELVTVRGDTVVNEGDELMVLYAPQDIKALKKLFKA